MVDSYEEGFRAHYNDCLNTAMWVFIEQCIICRMTKFTETTFHFRPSLNGSSALSRASDEKNAIDERNIVFIRDESITAVNLPIVSAYYRLHNYL